MGCCQSKDPNLDFQERIMVKEIISMSSGSRSEAEQDQSSYEIKKLGFQKIMKERERQSSFNSNKLYNGFINTNIINTPKSNFFDQYQIEQLLGQGGFGTVCIATQKVTNTKRAIKIVSKLVLSEQELLLLLEELAILKEIDHPNILKILEHYEDDENHFFVTELLSGGDLLTKIMELNGFGENQASEYLRQILSAVSYCHSQSIVHRDLKPENILFESKSANSQIKIIDFGCSTKFDKRKKIKDIAGTVLYLAPEVINKDLYDEKCDIWSLGVVLFIMLCGYPPFDAETDEKLFEFIQFSPLQFEGEEWKNISSEAKDLISKMLIKDPKKRISALEAYQHPWIQQRIRNCNLKESIMKNLAQFSARNKVKTAIMNMITLHILTNKDKQEIIQAFQGLDQNGDGQLSKEELVQGYMNIVGDREQAEKIVETVFPEIDYDGSGLVSFQEFLVATINKEKTFTKQNLLKAFDLIDEDRNGYISKDELEKLVDGTTMNDSVWEKMMMECDTNKDGQLDKGEFVNLLIKWLERDLFVIDEMEFCKNYKLSIDLTSPKHAKQPHEYQNQNTSQSAILVPQKDSSSQIKLQLNRHYRNSSGIFQPIRILSSNQKLQPCQSEFSKLKESYNNFLSNSYVPSCALHSSADVEVKTSSSIITQTEILADKPNYFQNNQINQNIKAQCKATISCPLNF